MKQKLRLVRILALISVLTFAAPAFLSPVFAADAPPLGKAAPGTVESDFDKAFEDRVKKEAAASADGTDCDGEPRAGICFPKTDLPDTPIEEILLSLMRWLFGIFGFIAIIAFVISGILYLTAAGNEDQIKRAKKTAVYAVIGILIALSGFIIITAIANFLQGYDYF